MLNERAIGGIFWLALGIALVIESRRLGLGFLSQPGPGFVALCAAVLMGTQGAVLFLQGIVHSRRLHQEPGERHKPPLHWYLPIVTVVALVGYAAMLPVLGFSLASFLFLFGVLIASHRRSWKQALSLASGTVVFSYVLFVVLLRVRLPAGLLGLG